MIRHFRGYLFFLPCDLDLGDKPIFENFNLANNFCTLSARAVVFHMSIHFDQTM